MIIQQTNNSNGNDAAKIGDVFISLTKEIEASPDFLPCDGREITEAEYPELYSKSAKIPFAQKEMQITNSNLNYIYRSFQDDKGDIYVIGSPSTKGTIHIGKLNPSTMDITTASTGISASNYGSYGTVDVVYLGGTRILLATRSGSSTVTTYLSTNMGASWTKKGTFSCSDTISGGITLYYNSATNTCILFYYDGSYYSTDLGYSWIGSNIYSSFSYGIIPILEVSETEILVGHRSEYVSVYNLSTKSTAKYSCSIGPEHLMRTSTGRIFINNLQRYSDDDGRTWTDYDYKLSGNESAAIAYTTDNRGDTVFYSYYGKETNIHSFYKIVGNTPPIVISGMQSFSSIDYLHRIDGDTYFGCSAKTNTSCRMLLYKGQVKLPIIQYGYCCIK